MPTGGRAKGMRGAHMPLTAAGQFRGIRQLVHIGRLSRGFRAAGSGSGQKVTAYSSPCANTSCSSSGSLPRTARIVM